MYTVQRNDPNSVTLDQRGYLKGRGNPFADLGLSCLVFVFVPIFCLALVFWILPELLHEHNINQKIASWEAQHVQTYIIEVGVIGLDSTLDYGLIGRWHVENGMATRLDQDRDEQTDIVMMLFEDARGCRGLFCHTKYDNQYGFPIRIEGGLVETGGLIVTDFVPLDDE